MSAVEKIPLRGTGVKIVREDGSEFETFRVYAGEEIGCPVEIQIFVGRDHKVEVHAYQPHHGPEIPLCEGPV